jgi:signal transduction histidine kinase
MPEERLFTSQEISEFLFRACHDLRTPLRAVRAHAELLVRGGELPANSGPDPRLAFIIEGAGKMDQLVDGLSSYSMALRIDRGSFVCTGLGVLLRSVLAKLAKEIREQQAEVTAGELPRVWGDPDRLMQLLENLLLTMLRQPGRMEAGGLEPGLRIHITAEPHAHGVGNGWLSAFRDNGPAIEAADLESIFQPFARWPGAAGAQSGLGLAVCREIVERHGGRIWAESPPSTQDGTSRAFLFTLPAERPD